METPSTPSTLDSIHAYITKQAETATKPDNRRPAENGITPQETSSRNHPENNAQLVQALRDNHYTITPNDKIISRGGTTVILQKHIPGSTNPDGSPKYHTHVLQLTKKGK